MRIDRHSTMPAHLNFEPMTIVIDSLPSNPDVKIEATLNAESGKFTATHHRRSVEADTVANLTRQLDAIETTQRAVSRARREAAQEQTEKPPKPAKVEPQPAMLRKRGRSGDGWIFEKVMVRGVSARRSRLGDVQLLITNALGTKLNADAGSTYRVLSDAEQQQIIALHDAVDRAVERRQDLEFESISFGKAAAQWLKKRDQQEFGGAYNSDTGQFHAKVGEVRIFADTAARLARLVMFEAAAQDFPWAVKDQAIRTRDLTETYGALLYATEAGARALVEAKHVEREAYDARDDHLNRIRFDYSVFPVPS